MLALFRFTFLLRNSASMCKQWALTISDFVLNVFVTTADGKVEWRIITLWCNTYCSYVPDCLDFFLHLYRICILSRIPGPSLSPLVISVDSVLKLNFDVNCPAHETTQMYTSSVEIKSITLENRCVSSLQSIDCMKWALTVPAYKIFFLYCIIIPILRRAVFFFTVNLRNELAYNIALVQFWVKGPETNLVRSVLVCDWDWARADQIIFLT